MEQDIALNPGAPQKDVPSLCNVESTGHNERGIIKPKRGRPGDAQFVLFLLLAMLALIAVFQGVSVVLVPAQLQEIDPANKVHNLGLVIVAYSVAAVLGLLLGGAVSDKTRTRWGKRAPWLVIMSIVSALCLIGMAAVSSVAGLLVAGSLLWFSANYYQAALTALVPDNVPAESLGRASALLGISIPLGLLIGVNMAAWLTQDVAYAALAVLFLAATCLFVVLAPEPPSPLSRLDVSQIKRKVNVATAAEFVSSFRSANFTIVFISRMLIYLSYFTVAGYLYYVFQDYIGSVNLPDNNVGRAVATAGTVTTLCWIPAALFVGWLAARMNRLKLFVGICALGIAAMALIPILSPSWAGILVFSGLNGAFFGTYLGIDLALMSLVLPNKEAQGRDMALLQIGGSGITIFAPAVAAVLIDWGGYSGLFAFSAIAALLGGVSVLFVRGIR